MAVIDENRRGERPRAEGPVSPPYLPGSVRSLPPNLIASGLMIMAFMVFCIMAVLMRAVGDTVPVVQVILIRQIVVFLLLAPFFWRVWSQVRRPTGFRLHAARGVFAVGSMAGGLSAVVLIPLADATAIQMAEVLFVTLMAALVLGEKIGWQRWCATFVGFLGIAIMVRPFGGGFELAMLVPLVGALFGALGIIALRLGSTYDGLLTVLFWQGVVILILVTPPALWFWVRMTWEDILFIAGMGVVFTIGQLLFTYASRMGESSALAPLQYLRLLMMAAIGYVVYAEMPGWPTIIGGLLVLAAASYTIRRNAQVASPNKPGDPAS